MNLKNKNYELMGRWKVPTLAWAPCINWNRGKILKDAGFDSEGEMLTLDGYWISPLSCINKFERVIGNQLEKADFSAIKKFIKETERFFDNFLAFKKNISSYNNQNAYEILAEFFKFFKELESPWIASIFIARVLEKRLIARAKKEGYTEEEIISFCYPIKDTFSMQQKKEMIELRNEIKNKGEDYPGIANKIKSHIKKYEWMGTLHFWGKPFDIEDLRNQFKKGDEIKERKTDKFSKSLSAIIKISSEINWIRQQSTDIAALMGFQIIDILRDISSTANISYKDIIWMTSTEILYYLKKKKLPDKKELEERKKAYGIISKNGESKIITGKELKMEMHNWFNVEKELKVDFVKGKVANPGKVVGKANIMDTPFSKNFSERDVLITSETTPDFLPLMVKASAFVTNIGGITSHAAIVSREMNKPCVIDTKNATSVFKDGDLIEVDADNGIVKIIKRA